MVAKAKLPCFARKYVVQNVAFLQESHFNFSHIDSGPGMPNLLTPDIDFSYLGIRCLLRTYFFLGHQELPFPAITLTATELDHLHRIPELVLDGLEFDCFADGGDGDCVERRTKV